MFLMIKKRVAEIQPTPTPQSSPTHIQFNEFSETIDLPKPQPTDFNAIKRIKKRSNINISKTD